jgi:hypothetical protein
MFTNAINQWLKLCSVSNTIRFSAEPLVCHLAIQKYRD